VKLTVQRRLYFVRVYTGQRLCQGWGTYLRHRGQHELWNIAGGPQKLIKIIL